MSSIGSKIKEYRLAKQAIFNKHWNKIANDYETESKTLFDALSQEEKDELIRQTLESSNLIKESFPEKKPLSPSLEIDFNKIIESGEKASFFIALKGKNNDFPTELTSDDACDLVRHILNLNYATIHDAVGNEKYGAGVTKDAFFALGHVNLLKELEKMTPDYFIPIKCYPNPDKGLKQEIGALGNLRFLLFDDERLISKNKSSQNKDIYNILVFDPMIFNPIYYKMQDGLNISNLTVTLS